MNMKQIRRLTPKGAWAYFAPYGVERFISEFLDDDRYDIAKSDYRTMCQLFVRDFPALYNRPLPERIWTILSDYWSNTWGSMSRKKVAWKS